MGSNDAEYALQQHVAAEVRAEMARQQMTQQVLARQLGTTQQTLSRRMTGEVPFDVFELQRIADIFGVPVTHFFPSDAPNAA